MLRFNQSEAVQHVVRIVTDRQDVVGISMKSSMRRMVLASLRASSCATYLSALAASATAQATAWARRADQFLTWLAEAPTGWAPANFAGAVVGFGRNGSGRSYGLGLSSPSLGRVLARGLKHGSALAGAKHQRFPRRAASPELG